MRAISVVALLLQEQQWSQLREAIVGWCDDLIELLLMGALSAFYAPVELGRAWRQDEEPEAFVLTGRLELGLKL